MPYRQGIAGEVGNPPHKIDLTGRSCPASTVLLSPSKVQSPARPLRGSRSGHSHQFPCLIYPAALVLLRKTVVEDLIRSGRCETLNVFSATAEEVRADAGLLDFHGASSFQNDIQATLKTGPSNHATSRLFFLDICVKYEQQAACQAEQNP